jgi:hypothetical protein
LLQVYTQLAIALSILGCLLVGLKDAITPLGYREVIVGITYLKPAGAFYAFIW